LALHWRHQAGKLICSGSIDTVLPSGGWCLHPLSENDDHSPFWAGKGPEYGVPADNHVPADEGIGKVLSKYLNGKSINDIGAGVGQYGRYFHRTGANIKWQGYDGAENIVEFTDNWVKWIDVTEPAFDTIETMADWVLSLEVGEHIPAQFTNQYLATLDRHNREGIILSWGVPGQGGHSHVNCLSNDEVIRMMSTIGYFQDDYALKFQKELREAAIYDWFKETAMVFKR